MSRRQLIIFSVLLTAAIILLSVGAQTKLHISARLSSVLLFPVKSITQFFEFLSVSNARITELEIMVNQLRLENTEQKRRILLDTTEYKSPKYDLLKAQIIGRDPSNINGYLYVNKGKKQEVHIDQPVLSVNGLVGKVKHVGSNYSIVETIENKGFAVSAVDVSTGINGVAKKSRTLIFDFIKIDDSINIGDTICTSGMSEIFPEGVMIGSVKEIDEADNLFFKLVHITPSVQVNRLVYVYILFGERTTALHEVEEANIGAGDRDEFNASRADR